MDEIAIIRTILASYKLSPFGIHGVIHWARVYENGLKLASQTGADPEIVALFALFHDSRRLNEGTDYGHGLRGANFASELRGSIFQLDDERFALLHEACARHTEGRSHQDVTVQTCWDADRLDLGRVDITPSPERLCTAAARDERTLEWAHERAVGQHIPAIISDFWGITLPEMQTPVVVTSRNPYTRCLPD